MTSHGIERSFLSLAGRQVHYRHAGSGPPVVLLHQSPKSSEELIPLIALLAGDFTVFAPDTPGYGRSDPITSPDAEIEIDVFADAVAEFFDAMGLEQAGLYGLHTGAAIATRFAARYPERVSALVVNGTLIKTPEERADLLAHYLPRFVPVWDGSHLAWAWARMREQMMFFPWHKRDPVARVAIPMTLDGLQINTLALLEAGDNYRTAYRTAFSYAVEDDIPHIQPPARFICAESDILYRYLERFPHLPPTAEIVGVRSTADAMELTRSFFRDHTRRELPSPAPATKSKGGLTSTMVTLPGGQLYVRQNRKAYTQPIIILHEAGSSSRVLDAVVGGFIGRRQIFVPDLPGHGDSDPLAPGDGGIIERIAAALGDLIASIGLPTVDIIAMGDSAAIALALAEREPSVVASLCLCNPTIVPDDRIAEFERANVPSLAPEWSGGHLLTAWHRARDQDLFWPWFDKSGDAVLEGGLPASDAIVQQRVIDLFKSENIHPELSMAIANDRVLDRVRRCKVTPHLFESPGNPTCPPLTALLAPRALGDSQAGWADRILTALA